LFDAGFDVSWELDLFGAVRHRVEAATAEQESQVEAAREIQTTVTAEVGRTYFELRGAQRRLDVIVANVRSQEETLRLIRDREQAGLASALDIARASAQLSNSRSQIPLLQSERQLAVHRLAVLTGRFPTELETQLGHAAPIPSMPPRVPLGLPSDLLHQRPDLRRLERQLAAATARSGVATAELFPRFFLTGAAGVQSAQASDLFDFGSRYWSLGPGLQWPVFSAGRLRQNIKAADARTEQALLRYEQGIRLTLEEVENALVLFGREQDRRNELSDSEVASRRAAGLANERYRGGLVDFLDVLEAERTLLAAQDSLAVSDQMMGQHLVRLFKALGGGWEIETKPTVAVSRSAK
jgi:NodT family efflux transporter outer membrane factor (OMF) lipoprotein